MKEQVRVTGITLSVFPLSENDRRLTILTRERGKIQVFARGCRKPNHPLFGVTQPLIYCEYMISDGRTSSYLNSAEGKDYFAPLKADLDMICYSTYFAELAEYFTVEGMEERDILNLLYITFKTMEKNQLPLPLIRRIFEYRILGYYGIGLEVFRCLSCGKEDAFQALSIENGGVFCQDCLKKEGIDPSLKHRLTGLTPAVLYTLQYVAAAPLEKLYSFTLKENVFIEFSWIVKHFMRIHVDHRFKSAGMLDVF